MVWAKNPDSGLSDWKPVISLFTNIPKPIFSIELETKDGTIQIIESTDDHPFFVVGKGWIETDELQTGYQIETKDGENVTVVKVGLTGREDVTYNFEVEDYHTYYVGESALLVHNSCWGGEFFYKGIGRQKSIDHIWDGHSFANKQFGKSYFSSNYSTKGKIKDLISGARARAKANHNSGFLRDDGKRIFQVEMDDFIGFDRQGRRTKTMTLIEEGGRYNNAFPGTL